MSNLGSILRINQRNSLFLTRYSFREFRTFHQPSSRTSGFQLTKNICTIRQNSFIFPSNYVNRFQYYRCNVTHSRLRCFHTTPTRKAWPVAALLVKLLGPLSKMSKVAAMLAGRSFRKLNPKYKEWLFTHKRTEKLIIICGTAGGLTIGYYFFHLEETPFTHRVRFMPIGNSQMEEIIESEYQHALELCSEYILPVNHPDHLRVFQVTKRLVSSNQCPEMEGITWQVNVVNTEDMNAFVLPNGQIFMFKGMLETLPNDSALATILGHEMAHALLKHGAEQASLHGVINLFIIVSLAILWAILPTDYLAIGAQWIQDQILTILLHLPYSRKLEEEADEVGMLLAAKACFDVRESPKVWKNLAVQEKLTGDENVEWLSTHPSHTSRAIKLESLLPEALQIRQECNCPSLEAFAPLMKTQPRRLLRLLGVQT